MPGRRGYSAVRVPQRFRHLVSPETVAEELMLVGEEGAHGWSTGWQFLDRRRRPPLPTSGPLKQRRSSQPQGVTNCLRRL